MGITLQQSGNAGMVTLEGFLTLANAEELKKHLIKAIIDSEEVLIKLQAVQEVDISCLQLLCSAHRSAVRLNKRVAFAGGLPKIFKDLVEAAGFIRISGCKPDCEQSCLWTAASGAYNG